jgi:hypothetical protein
MAHGEAREGKWRGNCRMEWVASTLHTTSEHGVSSITTANAHTSAASSRLNWRLRRFIWTPQFRRKTKSGFCACAITFQTQSTLANIRTTWDKVVSARKRSWRSKPVKHSGNYTYRMLLRALYHTVHFCMSEQTDIISLYKTDWLVFYNGDGVYLQRGTSCVSTRQVDCVLQSLNVQSLARVAFANFCAFNMNRNCLSRWCWNYPTRGITIPYGNGKR